MYDQRSIASLDGGREVPHSCSFVPLLISDIQLHIFPPVSHSKVGSHGTHG